MLSLHKIGIIQNTPLVGDFSNNLRQIVQGYRECIDHGAELVVAPACALCGADLKDLAERKSFTIQTQAALDSLSQELGTVPLILGAVTAACAEDEFADFEEEEMPISSANTSRSYLAPYLLESQTVTELNNGEIIDLNGTLVYIDVQGEPAQPEKENPDLIIHLCTTPWFAGAARETEENHQWEATSSGVPIVCVQHVGTSGENTYAGGSAVYSAQGYTINRLPFLQRNNKVINLTGKSRARALPEETELLSNALEFSITNTVKNCGYSGVCLSMDTPNAALLAALCSEALGASNVVAVTTDGNTETAKALGISCHEIRLDNFLAQISDNQSEALKERIAAALQFTYAEERGLLYLSSLSRREIMTGNFTLYGESCGHLAPFGNLYEMDLHMLRTALSEKYANLFGVLRTPDHPETDRIIHELADRNISATALLNECVCPFEENDVRLMQRKLIASALKRTQMPIILRVDRPEERIELPVAHRLND